MTKTEGRKTFFVECTEVDGVKFTSILRVEGEEGTVVLSTLLEKKRYFCWITVENGLISTDLRDLLFSQVGYFND